MDLDTEVKEQIRQALDQGDIQQIHDILDAQETAENPNIVKVEFTYSQLKFLELVRKNLKQPGIDTVIRLMVDGMRPNYLAAQKKAHTSQATATP